MQNCVFRNITDLGHSQGGSKSDHASSDDASDAGSCISMMSASTLPAFERSLKRSPPMTSYLDTSDIPESAEPVLVKLLDAAEMAYQQAATLRAYAEELRNALSKDRIALGQVRAYANCILDGFMTRTFVGRSATRHLPIERDEFHNQTSHKGFEHVLWICINTTKWQQRLTLFVSFMIVTSAFSSASIPINTKTRP